MTKQEKERITALYHRLNEMGFSFSECETLRKASMALSRWGERECNGEVERDEETGLTWHYYDVQRQDKVWIRKGFRVPDRETGAKKRITALLKAHNDWDWYYQTDPRGCAVYLIPVKEVKSIAYLESNYSTIGIAIY
jgi:hypothetical protein